MFWGTWDEMVTKIRGKKTSIWGLCSRERDGQYISKMYLMVKTGKSKAPPITCLLLCSGCRWRKICTHVNWSHLKFMHTWSGPTMLPSKFTVSLILTFPDDISNLLKPLAALSSSSLSAVTLFSENQSYLPPHLPSSRIFPTHSNFPPVTGGASHVPIRWASFFPMHILILLLPHSRNWSPVGLGSQERM